METYDDLRAKIKGLWPGSGVVLVASPQLKGTLFSKSVVLLCEANQEGAIGLVLTTPTTMRFNELAVDAPEVDALLYQGGPVEINTLHFYHETLSQDIGSKEIFPDIHWGLDYEKCMDFIEHNPTKQDSFRFFMGYAGWGSLQLEAEMLRGDWFATPATGDVLFNEDAENLWDYTLRSMGSGYAALADLAQYKG